LVAIVVAAVATVAAALLWRRQRRRAEKAIQEGPPVPLTPPIQVQGLTEEEAAARHLEGQDNAIQFRPPRSKGVILHSNIFTIFNLNLVGLVSVQLLLGRPLDALISLGVMSLNIIINIGQELLAGWRLKAVEEAARPQATVIRGTSARKVDSSQIVLGDVLAVGPGDPLFVDGELFDGGTVVVDESMLAGESARRTARAGDQVYAGSFCISGRAIYRAQKVGDDRLINSRISTAQAAKEKLTPIQQVIDRVLKVLLIIVAVFTSLLLLKYFRLDTDIPVEAVNSAASVIFAIAPSSLFFMIIVNYAMGTMDLARRGALVHRARSVESLAQAEVMCFAQAGILTGTHVEIKAFDPPENQERLADSRMRQILGDYARSTSGDNQATRALATSFEGNWRAAHEEAPFLSLYGWSAVAFDAEDLQGVYVLGDPQVLQAYLATDGQEPPETETQPAIWRRAVAPLGRFFGRSDETSPENGTETAQGQEPKSEPLHQTEPASESEAATSSAEAAPRKGLFRRFVSRVSRTIRRAEETPEDEKAPEEHRIQETVLLFAYKPELVPLHAEDGTPQLPGGLIPLCHLSYTERVRPETVETIEAFAETGVAIKILSSGAPDRTVTLLRQAGIDDETSLHMMSGFELAGMSPEGRTLAAQENTIFGHLTPEQGAGVVQILRDGGQSVAVVGDGVNDVPAMRQANLAIARRSSSQAALSAAEILLLEDSPQVLQKVLYRGQRIVNGLLDVLKLSLTQVFYLTLLILTVTLLTVGFPYQAKQGGLVNVLTVTLPAIGLSLFAAAGVLPTANLGRLLARFVAPAAITMSAAGLAVFIFFLSRTGEVAYAQLTLIYTLVIAGLLLVIFIRPPWRSRLGATTQSGDWRPTAMILILMALFLLLAGLPIVEELFAVDRLRAPSDYLVVGLAVLAWAFSLRFLLWVFPLVPRVPVPLPQPWLDETPGPETSEVSITSEV
jgi:magnesium-transporting ATPase (P-type)